MPLQPGAFLQGSQADVTVTPGVYDFTDDALTLAGQLLAISAGWGPFILDLENFAAESADVGLGVDLDGILQDLAAQSTVVSLPGLSDVYDGWNSAGGMLLDAVSFAPAQAWSDPGAPFTPPDSALTLAVPTINPGAYVPAPNQTVGAYSGGAPTAVTLFNSTRVGSQNFTVGDEFDIVALGKPYDDVQVDATFNGTDLGRYDYGQMNSDGQLFIHGVMGPENEGVWSQQWYVAGQLLASFNFVVSP